MAKAQEPVRNISRVNIPEREARFDARRTSLPADLRAVSRVSQATCQLHMLICVLCFIVFSLSQDAVQLHNFSIPPCDVTWECPAWFFADVSSSKGWCVHHTAAISGLWFDDVAHQLEAILWYVDSVPQARLPLMCRSSTALIPLPMLRALHAEGQTSP